MTIKEFIINYNEHLPTIEQIALKLNCENNIAIEYQNRLKLVENNKIQSEIQFDFVYFLNFYNLSIGSFNFSLCYENDYKLVFGSFQNLLFISSNNKIIVRNECKKEIELFEEFDFINFILLYHKYDINRIWNSNEFKLDLDNIIYYLNLDKTHFLVKYFYDEILTDSKLYLEHISKLNFSNSNKFLNCS